MKAPSNIDFNDLQGLIRCGHGSLKESCFLLLNIADVDNAKQWLQTAPFTNASQHEHDAALQVAFSVNGLRSLGLNHELVEEFSDEFITGMAGDESRSRRLGDIADNAPETWEWGGDSQQVPDILLMLYARENKLSNWRNKVEGKKFLSAFQLLEELPTSNITDKEPFGFADGISQPKLDWDNKQTTDLHHRDQFSNLLATGEVVLGYPNEYGYYTTRPLIETHKDQLATTLLPDAEDQVGFKDLGKNGTYLVCRQLSQDVPGFWKFLDQQVESDSDKRQQLANAMVGREMDKKGSPLIDTENNNIPGISNQSNSFSYDQDLAGTKCPVSAHIRRSNPRTGDLPSRRSGFVNRIKKILGFNENPDDDLITSTRFHRILRRGRAYGSMLSPEQAIETTSVDEDRGLQFICLAGNISRQFEFVQNAWAANSKFGGLQQQSDPLLGHRQPLKSGEETNHFHQPDVSGPQHKTCDLPQFVTVKGGGYFFMPGLSALKYLAALPDKQE